MSLHMFVPSHFRFVSLDLKEQKALTTVGNAQHRIGRVGDPDRTQAHEARQTGRSRTGRGKVSGGRGASAKSRRTKRSSGWTHEAPYAQLFFQFKLSMLSLLL